MKKVSVLLTKYTSWPIVAVYFLTGFGYNHTAIKLEDDDSCYYSFNYKGFCTESIEKYRRYGVKKSIEFELSISDESYDEIKRRINDVMEHRSEYKYALKSTLVGLFNIPYRQEKRYFCSQFISQLLKESNAVELQYDPDLYLPNNFCMDLSQCEQLQCIRTNVV